MGYRRNAQAALAWKNWQQNNSELILAAGLPLTVTRSEADWWEFLQHETRAPEADVAGRPYSKPQLIALRQLVDSWPGGLETLLGRVL